MSTLSILIAITLGLTSIITGFIYWSESYKSVREISELDEKLSSLRGIKFISITDAILSLSIILLNHYLNGNLLVDWIMTPLGGVSALLSLCYITAYFMARKLN